MAHIILSRSMLGLAAILVTQWVILFNAPSSAYCSYWEAYDELGYDPLTGSIDSEAAGRQVERWLRFKKTVIQEPEFDEELSSGIREAEAQVTSLDAKNLYDQLPFADGIGLWRGVGIRGTVLADRYRLRMADPNIMAWIANRADKAPTPWINPDDFGEFGFRVFTRPASTISYSVNTETHYFTDDLHFANVARVYKRLVDHAWQITAGSGGAEDADRQLLAALSEDIPRWLSLFRQYFTIDRIVAAAPDAGTDAVTFDLQIGVDVKSLRKDYPRIGARVKKLKGLIDYRLKLLDSQDRPIGLLEVDSEEFRFNLQFRTQSGRFLPLETDASIDSIGAIDLTAIGHQKLISEHSIRLNLAGLKLTIDPLIIDLNYFYDRKSAMLKAEFNQTPDTITAKGFVFGFLPIWLIDLFIPSNVEEMTRSFFNELASGNDGRGFTISYGSFPSTSSAGYVWLLSNAEVMSNGTIQFAFNMQRRVDREDTMLSKETLAFTQRMRTAIYQDFLAYRASTGRGGVSPQTGQTGVGR